MKEKIKYILLFVTLNCILWANNSKIYAKEVELTAEPILEKTNSYTIYQTECIGIVEEQYGQLIIEEGIDPLEIEEAKKIYDILPQNVYNYLKNNELMCIYTKDEAKFAYVPAEVSGYTMATYQYDGTNEMAYMVGNVVCIARQTDSIIHELGHAIDKTFVVPRIKGSSLSKQELFSTIYLQEASQSGLNQYYISQQDEYFAECFQIYFLEPEYLECNMPFTYLFMQNFITSL